MLCNQSKSELKTTDSNVYLSVNVAELISRLSVPMIVTGSFSEKYPVFECQKNHAITKSTGTGFISQTDVDYKAKFDHVYLYDIYSLYTSKSKFLDLPWNL
jgi:hypothetical protein